MEFQKHLALSLESAEIESWLANDSEPNVSDLENNVQRRHKKIPKRIIIKIYANLIAYVMLTFIIVTMAGSTNPLLYVFGPENLHLKAVTAYYFCSFFTLLQLIPYRHKYPWNYIFLFTLALGSSLTISTASVNHQWHVQFKAILATILWSAVLSWYAFKTNIDFTVAGTVLFCLLSVTFVGGMVSLSLFDVHIFMVVHASFGIFVFVLFFVYDTQIMIGGKHFLRIEPARHNYITINIYVNMQMLFYYHLTILSYYYGEHIY